MKLFKFNSHKEYDGPAASAPKYERQSTDQSSSTRGDVPKNIPTSIGSVSSSLTNRHGNDPSKLGSRISKDATLSKDSRSKSSRSKAPNIIDRSQPLASGISSRRTHQKMDKHQSANKMRSRNNSTKQTQFTPASYETSYAISKNPMHHDGGVTCFLPLPSNNRFLSGGVDGIIHLWGIPDDNPNSDPRDDVTLHPQLIKTYTGHKGYIHQLARLGWFDSKKKHTSHLDKYGSEVSLGDGSNVSSAIGNDKNRCKELFVSASQDNTLRIWELDGDQTELTSKGKKLRGHVFGGDSNTVTSQGVLCVCSVPSISPRGNLSFDGADQFVSGGSDGVLRVWDVRSALSLDKVPKSGLYSTVQIQLLEKDKISVLQDVDDESDNGSELDGHTEENRSMKKIHAISITCVMCTGKTLNSVALFAADSNGTIRRYSPKNKNSIGCNQAIWWEFTGLFDSGSNPVSSLTILDSHVLSNRVYRDDRRKSVSLLSSASSGCIRVWDGSDVLMNEQIDASETEYSYIARKKYKRKALWKIQLNENEDSDGEDSSAPTKHSVLAKNQIFITSLSTFQGRRLIAGATDGIIRIWDLSSGSYEGAFTSGSNIQIWSLAVVSEEEYEIDNDIVSVGIIVSGDNRGRIRLLKDISS